MQYITRTALRLVIGLWCLTTFAGCDGFQCPPCNATVTWNSYGDFEFTKEGDDATARRLVSECNWHVQGGHNGGVGETLQVAACGNEGVTLGWAFNEFHAFRLADGWQGKTKEGIGIGASLADFLAVYRNFTQTNSTSYQLSKDDVNVEANFDQNGTLKELIVGDFFRR